MRAGGGRRRRAPKDGGRRTGKANALTTTGSNPPRNGAGLTVVPERTRAAPEGPSSLWLLFLATWGVLALATLILIRLGIDWEYMLFLVAPLTLAGCAWKPIFGLTLMAALVPLSGGLGVGGQFSPEQGMGILFGLGTLIHFLLTRKHLRLFNTMTLTLFGLNLLAIASVLWAMYPQYALVMVRTPIQMLVYVVLIVSVVRKRDDLLWPLRIYVAACVLAFLGAAVFGLRTEHYRLAFAFGGGAEVNPNTMGAVFGLGFLTAIYLFVRSRSVAIRFLLVTAMALLLVGTMETGGRKAVFFLGVPLLLPLLTGGMMFRRPRLVIGILFGLILLAVTVYVAAVMFLPALTVWRMTNPQYAVDSFIRRLGFIEEAYDYVSAHPLGAGWACFRTRSGLVVHNDLFYLFSNLGVPGALLFLGFAGSILYGILRMPRNADKWLAASIALYQFLLGLGGAWWFGKQYWLFFSVAWLLAFFWRQPSAGLVGRLSPHGEAGAVSLPAPAGPAGGPR